MHPMAPRRKGSASKIRPASFPHCRGETRYPRVLSTPRAHTPRPAHRALAMRDPRVRESEARIVSADATMGVYIALFSKAPR